MPPISNSSRSLLRLRNPTYPYRRVAPKPQCLAQAQNQPQRRTKATAVEENAGAFERTPAFDSPFKNKEENPTTKIPSFGHYMSKRGETTNKTFQYFMAGSMGLLAAAGAKATVQGASIVVFCTAMVVIDVFASARRNEAVVPPGLQAAYRAAKSTTTETR